VNQESSTESLKLLKRFHIKTGIGLLNNATLCRPSEALIYSLEDKVNMFMGTDLDYMMLENLLLTKRDEADTW
jgi:carbamoyltransferase